MGHPPRPPNQPNHRHHKRKNQNQQQHRLPHQPTRRTPSHRRRNHPRPTHPKTPQKTPPNPNEANQKMDQTTKQFIQKLTTNLNYAAQTAPTLQKHPKHLTQLLKNPQLLQALKNDPALFTTLLLKLPNGQPFKPLPYQTKFLRDKNKRIVVCSGRQIGKTTMAAAKAIWYATMHPNTTTLIVSKALRQSMWMFNKIKTMLQTSPPLHKLIQRHGTTHTRIQLKPPINSQIIALPPGNDGNTIRGLTANLLIIDEANYIKPTIITSVCTPMITATNGTLILISTPQYQEHPFMQAFLHAAERGYSRYHFPSHIAPIPTPQARQKFLQEQQKQIPQEEYQREYLATLPDETNQLIPTKHIHNCIQDYPLLTDTDLQDPTKHHHADYAGYDPGGKHNPAAFITLLQTSNKTAKLTYIRETQNEPYNTFTAFIKHAHQKLQLHTIAVDATGLGKPIVEDLTNLGLPIQPITINEKTRLNLFRWLTVCFQQQHITIPDHQKLLLQLKSLKIHYTKKTNGKTIQTKQKITHPTNTHDDIAFALALALYAMRNKPNSILLPAH